MAEEFVRKQHYDEFPRCMDGRLGHANALAEQRYDSLNQRLADAEKAREQNLVKVSTSALAVWKDGWTNFMRTCVRCAVG